MASSKQRVIVVGGGLAGLMTTIKLAEAGIPVQLFSLVPVKRSHSVCAQGGINGAKNTKGEGDSPEIHFDDTIYGEYFDVMDLYDTAVRNYLALISARVIGRKVRDLLSSSPDVKARIEHILNKRPTDTWQAMLNGLLDSKEE